MPRTASQKTPNQQRHSQQGRTSRNSAFLYRKIADDLRRKIHNGVIAPGDKLPSLNELAETWEANRLTVLKAIRELREAGLVVSVEAQGTFAAHRPTDRRAADGERTFVIGLLSRVLNPSGYGLYHQSMISGLYDALDTAHANLLVLAAGTERPSAIPKLMRQAHADAMIYMGAFEPAILGRMLKDGPPAVVLDFDAGDLPVDGIRVNNPEIGRIAMRHLLGLGIEPTDIAILEGNPDDLSSQRRLAGAEEALREAGASPRPIRREVGWFMRSGGYDAMRRLLASGRPPKGLYCMNDEMASGALDAIREKGLRVPEDIRIIGTDDSLWSQSAFPPLTTIRIDARRMGCLAIRMLFKRIAAPEAPILREVLLPELVLRGS